VEDFSGPLLEEDHYYPFGLTMAGISDKALKTQYAENKYRFNKGSELQNKEFSDGSGLEIYETTLRELDPQLGRWWEIDPVFANGVDGDDEANEVITEGLKSQSPYASMDNNPIRFEDPKGDCPPCVVELVEGTGAAASSLILGTTATNESSDGTMGSGEAIVAALNPVGAWHGMVKLWNMISGNSSSTTAPSAPTATVHPGTPSAPTVTAHPGTPSAPTATQPLTSTTVDAHGQKKQSTGSKKKSGDNHMRQYKNNKKGNNRNRNQRRGAEDRRTKNKPID
jgi:RHS repeat-associated protein